MLAIGARSLADFWEVLARFHAIGLGLFEFYSVTDPSKADLNKLNDWRTRVEGAVTWLRKAVNALARAKMDEEETIVRLTIDGPPPTLLQKLTDGLPLSFPVELVAGMDRVHLRGVSATAVGSDNSWIDLEVTSPQQKLKSSQIILPEVTTRLGRVSSATSLNVRDVAGARPIINRSPIGDWKLRALRDHHGNAVERLDLDFQLSYVRA
jgi:hypothetical protein